MMNAIASRKPALNCASLLLGFSDCIRQFYSIGQEDRAHGVTSHEGLVSESALRAGASLGAPLSLQMQPEAGFRRMKAEKACKVDGVPR